MKAKIYSRILKLSKMIFPKFCIFSLVINLNCINMEPTLDIKNTPHPALENKRVELLLRQWGSTAKIRNNHTKTESDIAAVFIGVAYGAPTPDSPQTSTPTSTLKSGNFGIIQNSDKINQQNKIVGGEMPNSSPPDFYNNLGIHSEGGMNNSKKISKGFHIKYEEMIGHKDETTISYEEYYSNKSSEETRENDRLFHLWFKIANQLGIVWPLHLHVFEFLFCLVATIASFCLLSLWCSKNKTFNKLLLLLYGLILIVSIIRATQLFIDPYGVYEYLPKIMANIMQNILPPSIVAILALFLYLLTNTACINLILLPKGALFGISFCFTINVVVIDIVDHFIDISEILSIIESVVIGLIASWGVVLCLGFVVVILKIEKMHSKENNKTKRIKDTFSQNSYPHYIRTASRFGTAAGFAQLLISGLIVYTLAGPKDPPGTSYLLTWAWWLQHTLARLLEVILFICIIIGSAFIAFQIQSFNKSPFIFPLFRVCCRTRASGVHPSKVTVRQPLDIFTIPKHDNESVDYVTSDFQLVWTQNRAQSSHTFTNNFDCESKPLKEPTVLRAKTFNPPNSSTLPYKRNDIYKPFTNHQFNKPIGEDLTTHTKKVTCGREAQNVVITSYEFLNDSKKNVVPNRSTSGEVCFSFTEKPKKPFQAFNSGVPNPSSSLYWSPCSAASISERQRPSFNLPSRTSHSFDQISESNTVSQSDVRIDYLTDISSSVDGVSLGSEMSTSLGLVGAGRWNPAHTLPFRTFNGGQLQETKAIAKDIISRSETNTPLLEQELNYPSS